MRNTTGCDLRSTAGESIAEVLVGVLIVGLATVLFATMISVAVNISTQGTTHIDRAYEQVTQVDAVGSATKATVATVAVTAGSELNASFAVNVTTSSPSSNSGNSDASYTFSRYELAQSGEGDNNG